MALDPATQAQLAQDNLEAQARWNQYMQFSQDQANKQEAMGLASTITQYQTYQVGKAGSSTFDYMDQWVKAYKNSEAVTFGIASPMEVGATDINPAAMSSSQGSFNASQAMADLWQNQAPVPSWDEVNQQIQDAEHQASTATGTAEGAA